MDKLWGGRFEKDTAPLVEAFSESVSFDRRLYREDIGCSVAHAQMLCKSGLISETEFIEIKQALLHGMEVGEEFISKQRFIQVEPKGDFVTYGVGVSLLTMRKPEESGGRVPVS